MNRREIARKFDEIVAFSEIEQFLDTAVKRYSSGMYVRLAFAVAAHLEPDILIVDEVLAVGDAQFQKKCLGKMAEVAREGRTVLFVSHNMSAILSLCTDGMWLDEGRSRGYGPVAEVVKDYARSVIGLAHHDLANAPNRDGAGTVSYTHLDVYKRQEEWRARGLSGEPERGPRLGGARAPAVHHDPDELVPHGGHVRVALVPVERCLLYTSRCV